MENVSKHVLVYILSFVIFSCSVNGSYITAYATGEDTTHGGGGNQGESGEPGPADTRTWYEKLLDWGAVERLYYFGCQLGAIFLDKNLEQALANDKTWDEWLTNWENGGDPNTDTISYDEATDTVTMDVSEILAYLKEGFGFTIIPAKDYFNSGGTPGRNAAFNQSLRLQYPDMFYVEDGRRMFLLSEEEQANMHFYYSGDKFSLNFRVFENGVLSRTKIPYLNLKGMCQDGDFYYPIFNNDIAGEYTNNFAPFDPSNDDDTILRRPVKAWNSEDALIVYLKGGSGYLSSRVDKIEADGGKISIQLDDLNKDWEKAYNDIAAQLDEIKQTAGTMPTEAQIDQVMDDVLGKLEDIGGGIGDIGGDVEEITKTMDDLYKELEDIGGDVGKIAGTVDDLYKILKKCYDKLSEFYKAYDPGSPGDPVDPAPVISSIDSLKTALAGYHGEDMAKYDALLAELQEISSLLSSDAGTDYSPALDDISGTLADLKILMNDRLLALLEAISENQTELSGSAAASQEALSQIQEALSGSDGLQLTAKETEKTLKQIEKLLSDMSASGIDTSSLEAALSEIKQAITEAGGKDSESLAGMKETLTDIQDVLIDIKSGIAAQSDYTKALEDINDILGKIYKVEKLGLAVDITDLLVDFAALLDSGDTSFLDRIGTSLSNVSNASQEHFPTSIPWDLIVIFTALKADAAPPSYEVPFSMPALGVDETMTIDLSGFEQLSRISRTLLSILFLLLLIALTRKMLSPDAGDGG